VTDDLEEKDEVAEAYHKQLGRIDEVAQRVLNAHFQVEEALEKFIEAIFPRPEYVRDRLTFANRLQVARAFTPVNHDRPEWTVISTLNEMRNVIAHRGDGDARNSKGRALHEALKQVAKGKFQKDLEGADDGKVLTYAALVGSGFLLVLEEQLLRSQGRWTPEKEEE
jgi:hypothetical protein